MRMPLTPPSPRRGEGGVRGISKLIRKEEKDESDGIG
jgi:hypothetical protein